MEPSEKTRAKAQSLRLLSTKLGVHVDDLAFAYPEEQFTTFLTRRLVQQALAGKVDDLTEKRLTEVCNIPFNKDGRSAAEYAFDLIYGWLVEDMMYDFLMSNKFIVEKTGVDKDREFLKSGKIKSDIDLTVKWGRHTKGYDVYFDSQGYWNKNNKIDIRESKWKEISRTGSGMICVSNYGFAIIDAESEHTFGPNSAWGGKYCATINGIKDKLVDIPEFLVQLKNNIAS